MALSIRHSLAIQSVLLIVTAIIMPPIIATAEQQLPPGPENYRPETESVVLGNSVVLQWQLIENANLFRIQAAYTRNFDSIFLDDTTPYHFYALQDLPQDGARIFWRVRACILTTETEDTTLENLTCISEWSTVYSFYSAPPEESENEEETSFFRRVFGCDGNEDRREELFSNLTDLITLLLTTLGIMNIPLPTKK